MSHHLHRAEPIISDASLHHHDDEATPHSIRSGDRRAADAGLMGECRGRVRTLLWPIKGRMVAATDGAPLLSPGPLIGHRPGLHALAQFRTLVRS